MDSARQISLLRLIPVPVAILVMLVACDERGQSPRSRVLEFVKEVQRDTLPDISKYLDFDSIARYEYADARYDSLTIAEKKDLLVREFTGVGEYRRTWRASQIVVNNETILDDTTAKVEVSFIDRSTHVQYFTEMLLKNRMGWWIITDFRANQPHQDW